jgi:hypothetical protein
MTDLEHDLTTAADRMSIGFGDVDMVISRARHRRARRQRVVGGVTAVALVASLATIANLDRDAKTPLATQPALARGDADLHWEVLSSTEGLGMTGSGVNGAGPFYALSTAPGQADVGKARASRVLWRSDDGVSWTAATTLGNDLFLSDLAPADGRVYAVGTAPAQAGVKRRGDLIAGWSDDGGKTFNKKVLPLDWNGMESNSTSVTLLDTQIASNDTGTVVIAAVRAALDVPRLLPNGVAAPDGWATTATGVDILGPEKDTVNCPPGTRSAAEAKMADAAGRATVVANDQPDTRPKAREIEPAWCISDDRSGQGVAVSPQDSRGVVRSVTFSELGVSGDLLSAATNQVFAFFAPEGSTDFTRVDLGGVRGDSSFLDADDGAFHLFASASGTGYTPADTNDLRSEDGKTWTSVPGPANLSWVAAAGTVGGQRIVVGDSGDGTMIARADGAGGWVVTPLSSVIDPSITGGRPTHSLSAGIGTLGVVIAAAPEMDPNASSEQSVRLVFSRDGNTWEDQPIEKVAGHSVGTPLRIFVSGQRAVVALSGGSAREGEAPKPQTVLVGTPE